MLVSRQFGNEVVLANYENGLYYSLVDIGADIWLGLRAGRTVDDLVAAFSARHPSSAGAIAAGVPGFVDQLLAEGIIARAVNGPERQHWAPMDAEAFSPPALERFDDLRDLLLLDPVHDVGEAGWPLRADDAGR